MGVNVKVVKYPVSYVEINGEKKQPGEVGK